ncbi:MAG: hypothetical protein QGG36_18820 [Pirellulaceae bacterium]|jgi:hypothetical protein|nr:hypothetical protein [Pirellulaceae bacterium]
MNPEFPPHTPQFPATPTLPLEDDGFGTVWIKDESVNRWSGTHKDRMAWEVVASYHNLFNAAEDGRIEVAEAHPAFSLISSGSAAISIGRMLRDFKCPNSRC